MGMMINRRRVLGGKTLPYDELLPSLTIASGQTPAIITDYIPNSNSKFVFSCKITEKPSVAANKVLYGTFTSINNLLYRRVDCQVTYYNTMRGTYGDSGNNTVVEVGFPFNIQHNVVVQNGKIEIDGQTTSNTPSYDFIADYPLVLFSNCNNGTPSIVSIPAGCFVGTIYGSFDIYEGSTLMRSYHPAKKNGRIGLWESVTNKMLFSPYGEFSE